MDLKGALKYGRGGLIAAAIASSLMFGGIAQAHNEVPVGKNVSVVQKDAALRSLTDRIAGFTEKTSEAATRVSNQLYRTAIHESGGLKYSRQVASGGAQGVARSIFMVEPYTANAMVRWSTGQYWDTQKRTWVQSKQRAIQKTAQSLLEKESGLPISVLVRMGEGKLADLMMEHDHFAAAMARTKYLSLKGGIPESLEEGARYWGKGYQGTNNPVKIKKFIRDNLDFEGEVKKATNALKIKQVMKNHTAQSSNTVGLVKALNTNKTGSKAGTASSKAAKFLKKIITR